MKLVLPLLAAFALLALNASAQTISPVINNAVYTGSFNVETDLSDPVIPSATKTKVRFSVFVWLTGDGNTEYTVNASSIWFDGNTDALDDMTAAYIFTELGRAAVSQGVANEYTSCPTVGSAPSAVTFAAGVERTGSGSTTGFAACGTLLNRRTFSYTCTDGVASVTATGCDGGSYVGGCESTCGEGGLE